MGTLYFLISSSVNVKLLFKKKIQERTVDKKMGINKGRAGSDGWLPQGVPGRAVSQRGGCRGVYILP